MPTAATTIFAVQKLEPFQDPDQARTVSVRISASQNIARGTILGEVGVTGVYRAYASVNGDGSQVAKGIAMYDMQTDASGNITLSPTALQVGGEFGQTQLYAPMYYAGTFNSNDLVGLDVLAALTSMGGHLIEGTLANGIIKIG